MPTLNYVSGDTRPYPTFSLYVTKPDGTREPIDVSAAGVLVRMYVRKVGESTVKETLIGAKLIGWLDDDGELIVTGAYATPGKGGQVEFPLFATTFDEAGSYEAEVEIQYADGTVQTVFGTQNFSVRPQFG